MSLRHAPHSSQHRSLRVFGSALALLISLTATWPAIASAQEDGGTSSDIARRWQLLTYRDLDLGIESAPAGVAATLDMFAGDARGEVACSSYETSYSQSLENLSFTEPAIERVECDPASEAFDEAFYRNLAETTAFTVSDSIMTLRDVIGEPLMTLTRAAIDNDPTAARWELTRLGAADGSIEPVIQGLDPWLEFSRGGRVYGDAGCGSFFGWYETNDGTIVISDVMSRLGGCATESARRQAEQFVSSLSEITDFEVLPAGMALRDEAGTIRLALAPAIDLGERTWTPIEILAPSGETIYPEQNLDTSAVKFLARKTEGASICRPFDGSSVRSGLAISTAGPLEPADQPCKMRLADIEAAFLGALEATASHALRGSELELKDVDGRTLMRLRPQADLVGPTWVVTSLNYAPNRAKPKRRNPLADTTLSATFQDPASAVVLGDTGAGFFSAFYGTPAAALISIEDARPGGTVCSKAKNAGKPVCKQEALFLSLLQSADRYIVNEDELRLLRGAVPLVWFAPESAVQPPPESESP